MGPMNISIHRILHYGNAIWANSSTLQRGCKLRTDRNDRIAQPQGPSIEVLVKLSLEIFHGVPMVKRYPSKLLSSHEGNKKMRFDPVRFNNVRPMTLKDFTQCAQNLQVKRATLLYDLDGDFQTVSYRHELIIRYFTCVPS